ncbi:NAD(P)-dependent oxidoreductase [Pyxidicoccus caerfyrddinensis]|uniref:NAD(P)-dependent oxidoreductase n=1 Tax=Pyxidicoccus caerfyrddinensis TaxID=2709663 RepID=UPI0013DA4856|nr:SDR family oxidoreductase [Pyxidicoccus caerfyrddinensis]
MRIVVIGASQGTGALAVRTALERGHSVTAFARSPEKLVLEHPKLTRLKGDFHQRSSVDEAVRGQDAVIVTASSTSLKGFKENPNYFSQGTAYVIEAMKAQGIRRLSVLSALGTGESRRLANFIVDKLVISFLLKAPFEDHERQERLVRDSGLDWVIARPGRLTNGPARKRYVKKTAIEKVPSSISRADVADFLVEAVEADTWVRQAVQLGG